MDKIYSKAVDIFQLANIVPGESILTKNYFIPTWPGLKKLL